VAFIPGRCCSRHQLSVKTQMQAQNDDPTRKNNPMASTCHDPPSSLLTEQVPSMSPLLCRYPT